MRPGGIRTAAPVELLVEREALSVEDVLLPKLVQRNGVGASEAARFLVGSDFSVPDGGRVRADLLEVDDDAGLKFLDEAVDALMQNPLRRHRVRPTTGHLK